MPPNAAPATQSITESLIAAAGDGISEGNPKVLTEATTGVLFEQDAETIDGGLVKDIEKLKKAEKRKLKLVWRNIIAFGYLHLAALYGAYLLFTSAKWQTIAFVNRHVLKALSILGKATNEDSVTTSQILEQVKFQMRNLVPVPNIDMVIQKSLKNLSDIGLIDRAGPRKFAVTHSYIPPIAPRPRCVDRKCFTTGVSRKRSTSGLDPNCKRTDHHSDDSLSGDNYDRTRKRMRTNNKKVKYTGHQAVLPKVRQHNCPTDAMDTCMHTCYASDSESDPHYDRLAIEPENSSHSCDNETSTPLKVIELFNTQKSKSNVSASSLSSACNSQSKIEAKDQEQSTESVHSPSSTFRSSANSPTILCSKPKIISFFLYVVSGLGITAGAHRLWAHRSYKAKWPLRLILMIFNTIAFQDAAYHWARDHRVHHKYSETDADPHNATRGFFFSHIGWLLCKKHPEVKAKGKGVDLSDLRQDKIIMFQKKYYMLLMPLLCFLLPTVIPMYFWNETFINSWFVATMFRWCFILNVTWLVNSAAHKFGGKPYDKYINPAENPSVAILAFGEGWHNYHHVFPWDYKTAEFGQYSMNLTTAFIDFFAKIGWAYDLKTVSADIIKKRVKRTGDGTHEIWGWGDKDQPKDEIDAAVIINKKDE
ncbi:hypothetical protein DOY81_000619 [Sarcophaga bullata]|nr:hypothetical protein DOY81_000619 [Sarcophaga bullata]